MPSPILQSCLAKFVAAAGPLLQRVIDQAVDGLQQAESASERSTERRELAEAQAALLRERAAWVKRFPQLLEQGTQKALSSPPAPPSHGPQRPSSSKFGDLALVDDQAVAQEIEAARLKQVIGAAIDHPLAELDAYMSALLGLPSVHPERNPLQLEVLVRALLQLPDPNNPNEMVSLWWRHLAPPLAKEVAKLYRQLADDLRKQDVQAASYRVLPLAGSRSRSRAATPGEEAAGPASQMGGLGPSSRMGDLGPASGLAGLGPAGGPASAAGAGRPGGPQAFAGNDAQMWPAAPIPWEDIERADLSHPVLQEFIEREAPHVHAPLESSYYARVDAEIAHLESAPIGAHEIYDPAAAERFLHLPSVDRPMRHVGTESPLDEKVWGLYAAPRQRSLVHARLKRQAERVGQALGLELVRKLVNQVAKDPRLLAPVREAIVALEPSLLRLAMANPRYFAEEDHPARRLVERVAERSFRYNDEASPDFKGFEAQIAFAFNRLNQQEPTDPGPFVQTLELLENAWAMQDKEEEAERQAAREAMQAAEERQAEADRIAWELSLRSDLPGTPAVVQDFLYGTWALVMAQARLKQPNHPDPGGYAAVVTDLVWSVKREETLRQPARLFEIVPRLLERLRAGLAELGQDPVESAKFFHALEKLHRPVLKLRELHRREAMASRPAELEPLPADDASLAPAPAQKPQPKEEPWLARRELDATGYEETLPVDRAELIDLHERAAQLQAQRAADAADAADGAEPAAEADGALPAHEAEAMVANLREGCWVDLFSRNTWLRAQLIWCGTKGSLFMFHSRGGQPHSMTRRTCLRLVRERLLRPVDMHGVVEHALGAIQQQHRELKVA